MLKKILIGLGVVIVVFLVIVAFQPGQYRIVRSATMGAPASAVFAQVNDFRNWDAWSPWAKLDPEMKQAFGGADAGTGSVYAWNGNDKVGQGRMTVTESHTNDLVRIKLEFIKPFASECMTEFAFKPDGNQTAVTWTMTGTNNFVGKAFCLFMNMDKTVGGDFEKGLAQMKTVAEAAAKK